MWDCCCTGSKLVVGLLLYREQIMCGIAAVNGAKCVGVLLYRMQIGCRIAAVKGANCIGIAARKGGNCVWDCCCTGSKLGVDVLLYREQIFCGIAAVKGAKCVGVLL